MRIWIKIAILLLALQGPNQAWSEDVAPLTAVETTANPVTTTTAAAPQPVSPNEAEVANQLYHVYAKNRYNLRNCSNFADAEAFRAWGKKVLNDMSIEKHPTLLAGPADLVGVCPRYPSLSDDGKKAVWTLVLTGMAFYESTCRESPKEKRGPHGTLVGMFQLHKGKEHKYYTGGTCKKGDGSAAISSIGCVLSMLDILTAKNEVLFSRRSYWAVLRPQDKAKRVASIKKTLRDFPLCQN